MTRKEHIINTIQYFKNLIATSRYTDGHSRMKKEIKKLEKELENIKWNNYSATCSRSVKAGRIVMRSGFLKHYKE